MLRVDPEESLVSPETESPQLMEAVGDAAALLSGNVAAEGRVRVLLQNVGAADLKLPESTLRVVVHQFV